MDKELEKKYDEIVKDLYVKGDTKYHVLETVEGKKFKFLKSSLDNIVVIPFTDISTPMTISKYEVDLLLNKGKGNFDSYTKIILPYLRGEKSVQDIQVSNNDEDIQVNKKEKLQNMLNIKNIILYGAPGVGKTHNYKNFISMIEEGKTQKEIFETISKNLHVSLDNETFETIKKEKRVEFVTFHQSYSYEDFIEGFRPNENGNIELEDGIFKRLCENAINSKKEQEYKHITFEEAYEIFREEYIDGNLETIKTVSNAEIYISEFKEKSIRAQTENAKDLQYIKKSDLETVVNGILEEKVDKPADIKQLNVKKDAHSLAGYYFPFAKKIVEIMKQNRVNVEQAQNFYIVIDEINRGNISKIFGELITLIEEDKRDKYEVTLPYSKEPFKVPSNLYIIATMNSTDKSIATIDIALRRRFTFLKMKPNLELVKDSEAKELMQVLNQYISKKIGEDYMLGHSYFMGDIDLEFVKEYKIKPLLEEYFYADDKSPDMIMEEAFKEYKSENNMKKLVEAENE